MRSALTLCSIATSLLLPCVACTDDDDDDGADTGDDSSMPSDAGSATASSTTSQPATSVDGSSSDSADPSLALCIAWCFHRAECQAIEVTMYDCEVTCGPTYQGTPEGCHDEVDAIFTCAGALSCAEEGDFDVDDPSGPCGDAIDAYRACIGG